MLYRVSALVSLLSVLSFANAQICSPCFYNSSGSFTSGHVPQCLAFSLDGNCLAVANQADNNVILYPINSCIANTASPFTISTASSPGGIAYSSTCLAVTNFPNGTVYIYSLGPNCTVTNPGALPQITGLIEPFAVAFSPNGSCLAVVGWGNYLNIYSITGCTAIPVTSITTNIALPTSVAFSPNGACLAVANYNGGTDFNGSVNIYSVNPNTCAISFLTQLTTANGIYNPRTVAFSPNSACIAVANRNSSGVGAGSVALYALENCTPTTTTPIAQITSLTNPISAIFSANGSCLAVASGNAGTSNVSIFSLTNCVPAATATTVITSSLNFESNIFPQPLAFSPNNCLAIASQPTNTILLYKALAVPIITGVFPTCIGTVTVAGTGNPGDTVSLFIDGKPAGVPPTTISGSGNFTFSAIPVANGTHCFQVQDANLGCFSNSVCLSINAAGCLFNPPNLACGTHC